MDTAIAQLGTLEDTLDYTGTTEPFQTVSLRSRVEGQLLSLGVDVGDTVTQGQVLARLDDSLLQAQVNEAQAELSARRAQLTQAQTQVNQAQARVEQARAELTQARADAERLQRLVDQGAIARQEAEQAQTVLQVAQQTLNAAQEELRNLQEAIVAAEGLATAQQAVVAQQQERLSYTAIASPVDGMVLERVTEPGNLIQPGDEILRLGDFQSVKVVVPLSERELSQVRRGQPVQVRLDAFADQTFSAQVTRISPMADPTARLIPVEITLPNPDRRIGSGLLARVRFSSPQSTSVIVPESAIVLDEQETATVFVVEGQGEDKRAIARRVELGDQADGKVEILSGLTPGETFVLRSSSPLEDGQLVRASLLSER